MTPADLIKPPTRLFRWSTERYLALVESGIIPEGRGVELVNGQVIETMPQGELHLFMFAALQRVFAALGSFEQGLVVGPTVVLGEGNVFDPEFAFVQPEILGILGLPSSQDLIHIIEVSVSSVGQDFGAKKNAYALAGIPHYWVVDGIKRGVWVFTGPVDGVYESESFFTEDSEIEVPVLQKTLNLEALFPPQA